MAEPGGEERRALVEDLRRRADRALRSCIGTGPTVALLDVPTHSNVGDHAIVLGELAWLRSVGARIAYCGAIADYTRHRVARAVGDGIVLLHGGGNLGDVWPAHQAFRERVIADFPANRIVQLPQSIHFASEAGAARAERRFRRHRDLVLMARDEESLRFARGALHDRVELVPDAAFLLGARPRPRAAEHAAVCLARTDAEAAGDARSRLAGLEARDWIVPPARARGVAALGRRAVERARRAAPSTGALTRRLVGRYARASAEHLRRGEALLASGRVVATDRLHGHILCLLMGIPHVLADNSYGKLGSFAAAWTAGSPITRWAPDLAAAADAALDWAQAGAE
jgi:pyruvyl transferase EpsO